MEPNYSLRHLQQKISEFNKENFRTRATILATIFLGAGGFVFIVQSFASGFPCFALTAFTILATLMSALIVCLSAEEAIISEDLVTALERTTFSNKKALKTFCKVVSKQEGQILIKNVEALVSDEFRCLSKNGNMAKCNPTISRLMAINGIEKPSTSEDQPISIKEFQSKKSDKKTNLSKLPPLQQNSGQKAANKKNEETTPNNTDEEDDDELEEMFANL